MTLTWDVCEDPLCPIRIKRDALFQEIKDLRREIKEINGNLAFPSAYEMPFEEEESSYEVNITEFKKNRINALRDLMTLGGYGLEKAAQVYNEVKDNGYYTLMTTTEKESAEMIKSNAEDTSVTITIKESKR